MNTKLLISIFKKTLFVVLAPIYVLVAILGYTFDWWQDLWNKS
jgi:hypothetical protein